MNIHELEKKVIDRMTDLDTVGYWIATKEDADASMQYNHLTSVSEGDVVAYSREEEQNIGFVQGISNRHYLANYS